MSIQSTINQGLATTGFLLTQSPELQDRAEVRKLTKQYNKLSEYENALMNNYNPTAFKRDPEGFKRNEGIMQEAGEALAEKADAIAQLNPDKKLMSKASGEKENATTTAYLQKMLNTYNQEWAENEYERLFGKKLNPTPGAEAANIKGATEGKQISVQQKQTLTRRELIQQMREEGTLHKRTAQRALNRLKYTDEEEAK